MSRFKDHLGLLVCIALAWMTAAAPELGEAAAREDHPLIQRYPGSTLTGREDPGFREYKVVVGIDPQGKTDDEVLVSTRASGQLTRLFYQNPQGRSPAEIFANYKEALEGAGFEVLFECSGTACSVARAPSRFDRVNGMKRVSNPMWYLAARYRGEGKETYVAVSVIQFQHQIDVLEVQQMERGLVTVTAEALKKGFAAQGRAVLDGVVFDHDKATIKPESKPALDVIAKFLKDNPNLKAFIVGHTDMVGGLDYNLKLSQQRAQAVVDALVKSYGIAPARLAAHGVGPLAPARTNQSDEGKSENRRVEMVER
jgi:OmpA-OmpF porin, OOP family